MVIHNILKFQNHSLKIEREIASEVKTHAHAYLGNEDKNQKSGRTMTLTALKLLRVQIFASIRKAIAKKNGVKGNLHADDRPTDRPTTDRPTPATMIVIPLRAYSPRGKKPKCIFLALINP